MEKRGRSTYAGRFGWLPSVVNCRTSLSASVAGTADFLNNYSYDALDRKGATRQQRGHPRLKVGDAPGGKLPKALPRRGHRQTGARTFGTCRRPRSRTRLSEGCWAFRAALSFSIIAVIEPSSP